MQPNEVLLKPLSTEATQVDLDRRHCVTFVVAMGANKHHVRQAVEGKFSVRVQDVRTLVMPGKLKRRGAQVSRRPAWKKAKVVLADAAQAQAVMQTPQ